MKKTKKEKFVVRILTGIRNLVRLARLIYNKRHKKAGKIVKNETIRTFILVQKKAIKTFFQAHTQLFWVLGILAPISIACIGILVVGSVICWWFDIGIARDMKSSITIFFIFVVGIAILYNPIQGWLRKIK